MSGVSLKGLQFAVHDIPLGTLGVPFKANAFQTSNPFRSDLSIAYYNNNNNNIKKEETMTS